MLAKIPEYARESVSNWAKIYRAIIPPDGDILLLFVHLKVVPFTCRSNQDQDSYLDTPEVWAAIQP